MNVKIDVFLLVYFSDKEIDLYIFFRILEMFDVLIRSINILIISCSFYIKVNIFFLNF